MFGIPVLGPTYVFCDNASVVKNASQPDSTLNKKHHQICYHRCRESSARGMVIFGKEDGETNLSDILTKLLETVRRRKVTNVIYQKGNDLLEMSGRHTESVPSNPFMFLQQ